VSALVIASAEPSTLPLASITRDPALLCRASGVNSEVVREYADALRSGAELPPVVVFRDPSGVHWLADGHHRAAAAELAGLSELAADVREGSRRDALLHAAGANAAHGLRRSNADKRRAVLLVIEALPKWSDRKVAEAVGVSHPFVAAVRREGVVTVTTPNPAGSGEPPAPDLDRLVAKLTKALTRVFEQWPTERRAELRRLLDAADAAERGPS
jgi:ParB-like nuclease domain